MRSWDTAWLAELDRRHAVAVARNEPGDDWTAARERVLQKIVELEERVAAADRGEVDDAVEVLARLRAKR